MDDPSDLLQFNTLRFISESKIQIEFAKRILQKKNLTQSEKSKRHNKADMLPTICLILVSSV